MSVLVKPLASTEDSELDSGRTVNIGQMVDLDPQPDVQTFESSTVVINKGQVNHVDMLNNLSSTFGAPFQADEVIRYNFNSGVTYVPSTTVTTTELTTTTELATTTAVPSCAMLTCPSGFAP